MKKAVSLLSLTTPNSNRKRRRLRDTLAQLTKETEISPFPPPRKRPSAEHNLSMVSLLDLSNTPDTYKALAGNVGGGGVSSAAFSLVVIYQRGYSVVAFILSSLSQESNTMNPSLLQKIEQGTNQRTQNMIQ